MIAPELAKTLIGLLDLTSLNESDTPEVIRELCEQAANSVQSVAAVCVFPQFVATARAFTLSLALSRKRERGQNSGTREWTYEVATVVNFPTGDEALETVLESVHSSLQAGANEIDVVFPYKAYLRGEKTQASEFIRAVKAACGERACLKVILETGALPNPESIREMATAALLAGADFLKTSTGKVPQGASLEAAAVLLDVIREHGGRCGIKISGGVRTAEQAVDYYRLAQDIMGPDWPKKETFRIGASSLLNNLLMVYDSVPLLQK